MNKIRMTTLVLILAVALVLPFAFYELIIVAMSGMVEPYTYVVSLPVSSFSFALIQFSVGYGFVVGWDVSGMSKNGVLLSLWLGNSIFLWGLPRLFPSGGL